MTVWIRIGSLVLAILAMVPVASAAQSTPGITFGIKGGVNSATISSDSSPNIGTRLGAVGGLFLGARITDNIGLQLEGLYSQRGGSDEAVGSDAKFRLTYLDLPVLLKLGSASDAEMRFHVFGGGQASYKLKAEASSELLGLTIDQDDQVEDLDFSVVFGVGMERGRLSLDARYTLGMTNLATAAGDDGKNRTIAVMVGLRLK